MAKKKKKEKGKDILASISLDNVLKSSKKTESTLQGILKGFSEEKGYISPKEEEKRVAPQLSYESKKKIAEDYMLETVPISERGHPKERKRISKTTEQKPQQTVKTTKASTQITTTTKKEPSFSRKDDIYAKLLDFFEELFKGYYNRYNRWEESISSILAILRKMRKITKKNTEDLVSSINNMHEKIQVNLEQFKLKRDQIEKVSGVDIESMSSEFKKVLGLLELQVKEYQLKKFTDEYVHQQRPL